MTRLFSHVDEKKRAVEPCSVKIMQSANTLRETQEEKEVRVGDRSVKVNQGSKRRL